MRDRGRRVPVLGHHLGRRGAGRKEMSYKVKCFECGARSRTLRRRAARPAMASSTVEMDLERDQGKVARGVGSRPLGVWRYAPLLPVMRSKAVTLQEGGTPLYNCRALADKASIKEVFVKFEGANPTGSFKDRGMTVGVTRAVELGCKVVGCASTGNTSASLAAYAAKAGLECVVLLPSGKVAAGKLAQAMFYGAKVVMIDGNFDDALNIVREIGPPRAAVPAQLDQPVPAGRAEDGGVRDNGPAGLRGPGPHHPARGQRRQHLGGATRRSPSVRSWAGSTGSPS